MKIVGNDSKREMNSNRKGTPGSLTNPSGRWFLLQIILILQDILCRGTGPHHHCLFTLPLGCRQSGRAKVHFGPIPFDSDGSKS